MKIENNKKRILKGLSVVTAVFGTLSFFSFNCAPPAFETSDHASLSLTADGLIIPSGGSADTRPVLPQALLTAEQIYQSMLNLTDQMSTVSNGQVQEFNRREGALAVSHELNLLNAPMIIAINSFAGEVCNGLVQREQGLAANNRKFFQAVNFSGAVSTLTTETYTDLVTKMARTFWNREPAAEELTMFDTYRTEFVAAIPAAQINQNAQTRALVLSTCAAMLSSFDVFTY